jgi:carbonic anhydrase
VITAVDALARLQEGNRRFVSDESRSEADSSHARRMSLVLSQEPFAIVLGCSDSRAPAELIFDQGLGDLFVIRVAGNIVAPSQIGSVEFAAERFGTRLVTVIGHSHCGAVTATVDELLGGGSVSTRTLRSIVDRVKPAIKPLLESDEDREALLREGVRANVRMAVDHLRHGSELLERLIREEGLLVVGAEYSLESGVVEFFEGVPSLRD